MTRTIAANYIFPVSSPPVRNGYVKVSDNGEVISTGTLEEESGSTEFYNGIICPGFVNAHCHIELSHLKGKFTEGSGMSGFINQINELRESAPKEERVALIRKEMEQMYSEGVTGLGDISNCDESFAVKRDSPILSRTFIEVFGTEPHDVPGIIRNALDLRRNASEYGIRASVTPHSPYTMSPELLGAACAEGLKDGYISYHNQESQEEDDMFLTGTGALAENYRGRGLSTPAVTGRPAIFHFLEALRKIHRPPFNEHILLVHNTVTSEECIDAALSMLSAPYWVTCPKSNIFIHRRLAPIPLLARKGARIAIGTDSLSSNHELSMIKEMALLQKSFPEICFEDILQWACLNGAMALGMDDTAGSITPGKRPGIVLVDNFDFRKMRLTDKSTSRRII